MLKIKNINYNFFRIFFSVILAFIILTASFFISDIKSIFADDNSKILICIDPGHGGNDFGSIGPTGLREKDVDFDIAVKLKDKLTGAGFKVILTRESDIYKSLDERTNFANSNNANLFIGVHNNSFTFPGPNGTETYYCDQSPATSNFLANYINAKTIEQIGTFNRGVKTANFVVLKNTKMISALIEGAFMSNPTEEAKLKDPNFRDRIATGIYNGIIEYLKIYRNNVLSQVSQQSSSTSGTQLDSAKILASAQSFVKRIYQRSLNIDPDQTTINNWADKLAAGAVSYADVVRGIIISKQFNDRNLTDEQYIAVLYRAVLDRYPDSSGEAYWLDQLKGLGREVVLNYFLASAEFTNLVNQYIQYGYSYTGTIDGTGTTTSTADTTADTTIATITTTADTMNIQTTLGKTALFIKGLYINLYNREPSSSEINGWISKLENKTKFFDGMVRDFFASKEFKDRNLTNEQFIDVLYKAVLNRNGDPGGKLYWLSQLTGLGRDGVLYYFLVSSEFSSVVKNCTDDGYKYVTSTTTDTTATTTSATTTGTTTATTTTTTDTTPTTTAATTTATTTTATTTTSTTTADTSNTITVDNTYTAEDGPIIAWLLTRLYKICYNREPNDTEKSIHAKELESGSILYSSIAINLILSKEFSDRKLSNEDYVKVLYMALFDRSGDSGGIAYWTAQLNGGIGREVVLYYFRISLEVKSLSYLITKYNPQGIQVNNNNSNGINPVSRGGPAITSSTSIIGYSNVTKDELINMFIKHNTNAGAVDRAKRLADFYILYGQKFNIRADIAWAQMCHETGFLAFTGDVKPEQNNFAGIGATGGGVPGNSFATEELGVIAHYIHLAWYLLPNHLDIKDSNGDLYCSSKYDPRHFNNTHNYNGSSSLSSLNSRWGASSTYANKIIQFANEI
ncbi:MAG: DUF4214 domain-containing protein [Cyanobacteria bacterium]|nr:DUF4214 domain-containing protein [Cyanobacteriota bacterium]